MNTFALAVGYAIIVGSTIVALGWGAYLLMNFLTRGKQITSMFFAAALLIHRDRQRVEAELARHPSLRHRGLMPHKDDDA